MSQPLLKWTGHPLADVGVATLCALVGKKDPEKLTLEDLDVAGKEIKAAYKMPLFVVYLSCVYTTNGPFTHPSMGDELRVKKIQRCMFPHRGEPDENMSGLKCLFSGEPATHLMERSQMPMLTGAGVLNFFPAGRSELPVAGPYLLAIHALAIGGRRSEGGLLIVHCDDPQWTLQFARRYVARNRQLINMAKANELPNKIGPTELLERECAGGANAKNEPKYPYAKAPKTLVMADLTDVATERDSGRMAEASTSVTIYLLSNDGRGPSLSIEHIPGNFVQFLQQVQQGEYANRWQRLVHRSWHAPKGETLESAEAGAEGAKPKGKGKAKAKGPSIPPGPGRSQNYLYNDLLDIYKTGQCNWEMAARFIRRHLLLSPRRIILIIHTKDSRDNFEIVDWELVTLFLMEMLGMNKDKIECVKAFADKLADVIRLHDQKQLYRGLAILSLSEYEYRRLLVRFQRRYATEFEGLLFSFDEFVDLFLSRGDNKDAPWTMVRDLIAIRVIERLYGDGWLSNNGLEVESADDPEVETVGND